MLNPKLITSPIEYRIIYARENISRGTLYHVKNYNLYIICKHFKDGKFTRPTKHEMTRYGYDMEEFIYDWIEN
jgi:hypothetical protein